MTHDRGAVIRDVAVAIAGGAENLAGTAVLRNQARLFGRSASHTDIVAVFDEIDRAGLARIALVRNKVRQRVWELIEAYHGAIPPSRTCYRDLGDVIVIRIDASLIDSHSDKECAAGELQGRVWLSPAVGVLRQHRRAAGGDSAQGQRRLQHDRPARPRIQFRQMVDQVVAGTGAVDGDQQNSCATSPGWRRSRRR